MKRWEVQKAKIYVECPGEKKKKTQTTDKMELRYKSSDKD